jgi:hypothetical protein
MTEAGWIEWGGVGGSGFTSDWVGGLGGWVGVIGGMSDAGWGGWGVIGGWDLCSGSPL